MIDRVLAKVFGTQHERDIKKLLPRVERINALEPAMKALPDEGLAASDATRSLAATPAIPAASRGTTPSSRT